MLFDLRPKGNDLFGRDYEVRYLIEQIINSN